MFTFNNEKCSKFWSDSTDYYFFLNLGRSSRGGRQKLILEIIAKLLLLLNEEIKVA